MARRKSEVVESEQDETGEAAPDIWAAFETPEGFEEVERRAAKRLEPGESLDGVLIEEETREGHNPNTGEIAPYQVYTFKLTSDGSLKSIGGAPILDSLMKSIPGQRIGKRMFVARAEKNVSGKRGRTAGQYRVMVAKDFNGRAKA